MRAVVFIAPCIVAALVSALWCTDALWSFVASTMIGLIRSVVLERSTNATSLLKSAWCFGLQYASSIDMFREQLVEFGGARVVVQLLDAGSEYSDIQLCGVQLLDKLSYSTHSATGVALHGGITAVVKAMNRCVSRMFPFTHLTEL